MKQASTFLRDIMINAHAKIKEIPEAEMNEKPAPGKWSKKELLGHLIDSATNNYQRFIRAQDQQDLVFPGYDQDAWVLRNRYQEREVTEVLDTWWVVNRHIAELLETLPEDVVNRKTNTHNFDAICMRTIPKEQSTTLSYLIGDYLYHLEYHLSQIIPDYHRYIGPYKVDP